MKVTHSELKEVIREVMDELPEGVIRKVIRNRKMVKKRKCHPGQKSTGGAKGRCVAMKGRERAMRKRMAKKSAVKRRGKLRRLLKKRARSMKKRNTMNLR
tara:strand:+ start:72 stop:371 length:300 start_codon:yes stop_codon:yes gene_type:complete